MSLGPEQLPNEAASPELAAAQAGAGAWLRDAREKKRLTLDDLHRTTKIGLKFLTALEAGDVGKIPATFFTRGFVKAYAKEVGLDPDRTADQYLERVAPDTGAAPTVGMAFEQDKALIETPHASRFGRLTLVVSVIGLVVYLGPFNWDRWASKVDASAVALSRPSDALASTMPAPAPAPAPAVAVAVAADVAGPLQVEMSPLGPCWFSASADGNQVQSELLQAGDNRMIQASQELVLRVGDADACAFSINGRAGRPLGSPGAPVTVRITKDNFRELLSS